MPIIAGQITGSALSGSLNYTFLSNIPSGIVSGAAQVAANLPAGTVSSSGQVDYNSIANKLSGVVSSSTQVKPLLPGDTVSASNQVNITSTTNYSTFSSSLATVDAGQTTRIDNLASLTSSYAINSTIQGQLAGVASSSSQVKAFLPADTVSSSNQVSITATTGYSTFSSSIATKNDLQDISINALNAATSSYAINSTIQNQLAGVASSSAQVKAYLPGGTVSSSGQVDITATTGYGTFSSSLATVDVGQTTRIDNLASQTSSYAINATIQGQLAGVVSSSTQVKPLLPGGTVSASGQVVVQNTTGIGALATTGSNTFTANQTITGSLFISQNLTVLGSSSISFISQSSLNIGTSLITVNVQNPGSRFGGLSVIDSGSSPNVSGSIFFDSINDQWIFIHQQAAGAGVTSSLFLMGPQTFDNVGNETNLTTNRIPKSQNAEHLSDSQISDNGVTVSITNGLTVGTNLTASNATITGLNASQAVFTDANDQLVSVATTGTGDVVRAGSPTITGTLNAANITATGTMLLAGILSQSSQVSITGTTGYSTFSSSIATKNDLQDVSLNALNAATSSYAINATIQNQLAGVASSSSQVKAFLPGGSVSSSAQYPGWVTASSQIDYNSITNKLSGVVSASAQVQPLLPAGTVSSSAQVVAGVASQTIAPTTVNATNITASALTANQAVFTNASDGLVSNAITGTGNVVMSASPTLTGTLTAANITANGTLLLQNIVSQSSAPTFTGLTSTGTVLLAGIYSSSAQTVAAIASQTIAPTTVNATTINVSTVTASALTANQAVFTNASDGLVSNAITGTGNVVMSASPTLTGTLTAANITATGTMLLAGIVSQSSQIDYNSIQNKLSGAVSSSAQVQPLLPGGTVSASGQVDITATTNYSTFSSSLATVDVGQTTRIDNLASLTSSYAINATIQGQLAGVVSSSAQVKPLLPGGTVSASGQVDITATTGYSTFSSSLATVDVGQTTRIDNLASLTSSYAINSTIQGQLAGVVSSSAQVKPLLPGGTVTSSAQYPGWVTASSQIDYNSITNKLSGVVSSSTQIVPLLPAGTISASSQVALSGITGTTFATANFTFPQNLTVAGTLTAEQFITEYVSASVIYESGSSKFGDTNDDVMSVTGSIRVLGGNISGSFIGLVSQSAQIDYNSIQNKLSGVVSSSAQVQPLLPGGTVSSSAQYPGWVTSSTQIVWASVNYNGGIVSSSAQVKPLLPGGTVSSSGQVDYNSITNKLSGVVSSSTQIATLLPASTVSSSAQVVAGVAGQTIAPATVNATSILSGSVLQTGTNALIGGKLAVTGSAEFTGTITASNLTANQAVFTNAVDGLVSNAITGTGNVVMSASPTLTGTLTAANITATGTMLLAGIPSSSAQIKTLLPGGTVSSSVQVDYNSITNKLSGVYSSSAFTSPSQGTARLTLNGTALTDVDLGLQADDRPLFSGSQFSGIVSGSGLAYRLVVPVGTNQYAT